MDVDTRETHMAKDFRIPNSSVPNNSFVNNNNILPCSKISSKYNSKHLPNSNQMSHGSLTSHKHHSNGSENNGNISPPANMQTVNNTPRRTTSSTRSQQAVEELREEEAEAEAVAETEEDVVGQEQGNTGPNSSKGSSHSEDDNEAAPAEVNDTLNVHAWNIRSLNNSTNKHAVALHLERHQPDILIITETWLNKRLPNLHQNYSQLLSPHNDY